MGRGLRRAGQTDFLFLWKAPPDGALGQLDWAPVVGKWQNEEDYDAEEDEFKKDERVACDGHHRHLRSEGEKRKWKLLLFFCPHPCHAPRLPGTRLPHMMNPAAIAVPLILFCFLTSDGRVSLDWQSVTYSGGAGRLAGWLAGSGWRPSDSPFNLWPPDADECLVSVPGRR